MRKSFQLIILLYITTFILLINTIVIYAQTPAPSPFFDGEINVGEGPLLFTLSPTVDVNALTGRGIPTKSPTLKPTYSPTEEGFGTNPGDVILPDLPGVLPEGTTAAPQEKSTDAPTYLPTAEPQGGPTPVDVPAPTLPNGADSNRKSIGRSTIHSIFGMVVGCCYMVMFGL